MAAAHWQAAMSAFFVLSGMGCIDEFVVQLRKSSCEHLWCNDALEKDGIESRLGWFEHEMK
jgi:hypothetical protein